MVVASAAGIVVYVAAAVKDVPVVATVVNVAAIAYVDAAVVDVIFTAVVVPAAASFVKHGFAVVAAFNFESCCRRCGFCRCCCWPTRFSF